MLIRLLFASKVRRSFAVCVSASALVLSGCGIGMSAPELESEGPAFHGNVHGGQYPVAGTTVKLWVAGNTGYGSTTYGTGSTLLATATTDTSGNFAFGTGGTTYTCPSGLGLLYLTAQSGDSTGTGTGLSGDPNINTAIALMSVVSTPNTAAKNVPTSACPTVKTANPMVQINEVTTVASIFALAQFYNPATETSTGVVAIGSPSTNVAGITAGFNVVPNLVTLANGYANASSTPTGVIGGAQDNHVTAVPEYMKINLIANILAACVNSPTNTSSACATLFANAVPPPAASTTTMGTGFTFPTAKDTLTAAYYMAVNPINASTAGVTGTTAMTTLTGLALPTSPFQPAATSVTDWTIGVTYSTTYFVSANTGVISYPSNIAVDANDLIWFSNQPPVPGTSAVTSITSLDGYGGLNSNGFASRSPTVGLTLSADTTSSQFLAGVSATVPQVYRQAVNNAAEPTNGGVGVQAQQLAEDNTSAAGNLFFTQPTSGFLYKLANTSLTGAVGGTVVPVAVTPLNAGNSVVMASTSNVALDTLGDAWVPSGAGANAVSEVTYSGAGASTTPVSVTSGLYKPNFVAVDHSNNVWVSNAAGNSPADGYLAYIPTTAGVAGVPVADATNDDGGVNNPFGLSIDGAGNVWVVNEGQAGVGVSVSELALVGGAITPMSPSTGFTHTFNGPTTLAVDMAGNVWVANTGSSYTVGSGGMVTEILGAAVPVVGSLAKGVANNTLGTKP